jgi:hypothetical protein
VFEIQSKAAASNWYRENEICFNCFSYNFVKKNKSAMCWGRANGKEEPVLWVAYGDGSMAAWTGSGTSVNSELTNAAENGISHISWYCGTDPNSGNQPWKLLILGS